MATPDFEHQSNEVEWSILKTYEYADNSGTMRCRMTGFPQRKGEVVYRGAHIDDFEGFFTIGQDAAEQLARLVGYVDPDTIDTTVQQAADALERIEELERHIAEQDQVIEAYGVLLGPLDDEDSEG
jgi:hypothetical protein